MVLHQTDGYSPLTPSTISNPTNEVKSPRPYGEGKGVAAIGTLETVEILCGQTWLPLPDNALRVIMKSNDFVVAETADGNVTVESGRAVGDSLKGRRYLGLISPQGSFVPGEGDPFAEIINSR